MDPKYSFLSCSAALTPQHTFYQEIIQAQQRVNFFIQSQRQLSTILCSDWMKQSIVDSLQFLRWSSYITTFSTAVISRPITCKCLYNIMFHNQINQ